MKKVTDLEKPKPKNTTPKAKPYTEPVIEGTRRNWLGQKSVIKIMNLLRRQP